MLIRWDTLLIAVAVAGGSVLIENSHRVDTGSPDDEVVASAPADCTAVSAVAYSRDTISQSDADDKAPSEDAAPSVPSACTDP